MSLGFSAISYSVSKREHFSLFRQPDYNWELERLGKKCERS
jgi:hypothetical protein